MVSVRTRNEYPNVSPGLTDEERTEDLLRRHSLVLGQETSTLLFPRQQARLSCTTDAGPCSRQAAIGRLGISLGVSSGFRRGSGLLIGRVNATGLRWKLLAPF